MLKELMKEKNVSFTKKNMEQLFYDGTHHTVKQKDTIFK